MTALVKWLSLVVFFVVFIGRCAQAATISAASCSQNDVKTAITSASEGDTITVPPGTCSWTSGVTISGKGITVQGAGAGRAIAYSLNTLSISPGSKSLTIVPDNVAGTMPTINAGQTLILNELGFSNNTLTGTVASFSSGTGALVLNVSSASGTCGLTSSNMISNCARWLVSTPASTTLTNSFSSNCFEAGSPNCALFIVSEDSSVNTTITGIHFAPGTGNAGCIIINRNNSGGIATLIHDNYFEQPVSYTTSGGNVSITGGADCIMSNSDRGVIWNNTFVDSPFNSEFSAVRIADGNNLAMPNSWTTPSTWGALDTTGQNNLYLETNDLHAYGVFSDWSDNTRAVVRYNFLDHAGAGSHGSDTGNAGNRHFEFYNNVGLFVNEGDCTGITPNLNWWQFMRGGSMYMHDNVLPAINSCSWGSKGDVNMTVMELQLNIGNNSCWGAGTSKGAYYPAPRQPGTGYVTGQGTSPNGTISISGGGGLAAEGIITGLTGASGQSCSISGHSSKNCVTGGSSKGVGLLYGGSGYTSPSVSFSGGVGCSGVTASAAALNGVVTSVTQNSGGKGCTAFVNDSTGVYVGDSEPMYFWNNSRTVGGALTPLNVVVSDYGPSGGCSSPDTSANYLVANRDYFNSAGTPPSGYTPYVYPHPLTQGSGGGGQQTPPPPQNLQATPH